MIVIHGGQTGVDRGAHEFAIACGLGVHGFMPSNRQDEEGLIPRDVAAHLMAAPHQGGLARRTTWNIGYAHALIVMVPDKQAPYATPGTKLTLELARSKNLERAVVDPGDSPALVGRQVRQWDLEISGNAALDAETRRTGMRLMIAGPRETRWLGARAITAAWLIEMYRHVSSMFPPLPFSVPEVS